MSMRTIGEACGISWSSVGRILRRGIRRNFSDRKKAPRTKCSTVTSPRSKHKETAWKETEFFSSRLNEGQRREPADVSERTVNRFLQRREFHYLQRRKVWNFSFYKCIISLCALTAKLLGHWYFSMWEMIVIIFERVTIVTHSSSKE